MSEVGPALDFPSKIFRDILRPALDGVESDDADWVFELTGYQAGNDGFEVRFFDVCLAIGSAQSAKIVDNEVDVLIVPVPHDRRRPTGPTHTPQLQHYRPTINRLATTC